MTIISIDWDFFVYNGESERLITLPNGDEIPGIFLYDWGHNETNAFFGDHIWAIRAANFTAHYGLDIYEEVKIREDLGSPSVEGFVEEIKKRFDVYRYPLLYADSHANGIVAIERRAGERWSRPLKEAKEPLNVVSFDAHHDLGYDEKTIELVTKEHRVDAGSWLLGGLDLELVENVVIVYPDWRGLWEWGDIDRPHLKKYLDAGRIEITTWSKWLHTTRTKSPLPEASVFACRSSAWTPPWMDSAFADLIDAFPTKGRECLDHEEWKVGAFDACEQREWDEGQVRDMAAMFAKAQADFQNR